MAKNDLVDPKSPITLELSILEARLQGITEGIHLAVQVIRQEMQKMQKPNQGL